MSEYVVDCAEIHDHEGKPHVVPYSHRARERVVRCRECANRDENPLLEHSVCAFFGAPIPDELRAPGPDARGEGRRGRVTVGRTDGVETPQATLERLILEHPGLPVMKLHTECDEDDGYVLELTGAWLGGWWLADGRVWDDFEDACHALGDDWVVDDHVDGAVLPGDLPHGRCIWVRMDYWKAPS